MGAPTLRVRDFPAWSADRRYTPTGSESAGERESKGAEEQECRGAGDMEKIQDTREIAKRTGA